MQKTICVYCASSIYVEEKFLSLAYDLGTKIASDNYKLVYGGSNIGLMKQLADGAKNNNGYITGVIPNFFHEQKRTYHNLDKLILTNDLRDRKAIMQKHADAFIALPGGFGTLEELFEILTLKQLGLEKNPVVILNAFGFYDNLLLQFDVLFQKGFTKNEFRNLYYVAQNIEDAFNYITKYQQGELPTKW